MAKSKNKKRNVAKRQQQAGGNKKLKRKLKLIKLKAAQQRDMVIERPPMSGMAPPEGFRTISSSQAMMEYARPIMEKTESEEDLEGAMQAAMVFWNYSLALKNQKSDPELAAMKKTIMGELRESFNMDETSAQEFLDMMVARYDHLFPEEIQPKGVPFMFIRKEVKYLIRPIEGGRIKLDETPLAIGKKEHAHIEKLRQLDDMIGSERDWDDIENVLSSVKEPVAEFFQNWLIAKGLEVRLAGDLSNCLFLWFDFIYAYGHNEDTCLASVPASSWDEFFHDFLLRKMMVEPPIYVNWPPALKLFYKYLGERGFVENRDEADQFIRDVEPDFYDLLKRQFS